MLDLILNDHILSLNLDLVHFLDLILNDHNLSLNLDLVHFLLQLYLH